MSTNPVSVFESRGVIEARKLKPRIENAKRVMIEAAIEIGSRYRDLDDSNKKDFRNELGIKLSTAQFYALVSERYMSRASMLEGSNTSSIPLDKTLSFAIEISRASDDVFTKMVESGAITLASTVKDIRRAKTISPLKSKLNAATKAVNMAARCINTIRAIMQKEKITEIRGPEIRHFREEFQLLCAELLAADPETVERAKQVLKGVA